MEASGTSHHQVVSQECRVALVAHAHSASRSPPGDREDERSSRGIRPLRAEQPTVEGQALGCDQAGGRVHFRPEDGVREVPRDLAEESTPVM